MNDNTNQEIDLIYLAKKIKAFFYYLGLQVFIFFQFILKVKYILFLIIIIGATIGFIIDKYSLKKYKTELVVIPNFNSTDYLYSEIENMDIFKKENSVLFNDIIDIEINPILDTKSFIENSENKEFLKILSENGLKFNDILKDKEILKTNKFHQISLTTKTDKHSKEIIDIILKKINSSKYYINRSKLNIENLNIGKIQLKKSIEQINIILDKLGRNTEITSKDISINNYDQLNLIIDLKRNYLDELLKIDTKLVEYKKTIYPVSISYNHISNLKFYSRLTFVLPIIFLLIFFSYSLIKIFYIKFSKISKSKNVIEN
ncbi:hypothetical protein [Chishuiella sp.]|uniref:hypothetical protein n=1 Tax=Chishuiella sp. TaxID=1969467 RepID=UPI0028A717D5|nr:hypothetical protein [Chishuiella sp.]